MLLITFWGFPVSRDQLLRLTLEEELHATFVFATACYDFDFSLLSIFVQESTLIKPVKCAADHGIYARVRAISSFMANHQK